jgi:glucose/arabinose dehydrogenase
MRASKITFFVLISGFFVLGCKNPDVQSFNQEVEHNIQLDSTLLSVSVVADSLIVPWELAWGPDDWIWVTEERGNVYRINPITGEKRLLLQLPIGPRPEGLQSMIVHPDQERYPYVYLNYKSFDRDSVRFNIVERYTFDNDALIEPKLILQDKAGRSHTGARLAFHGPDRILWATGDQFVKEYPQDLNNLNGKVLRMDLEGNVPDDNPYPGSYVYAFGFRNMQGMTVTPEGTIYISEHGDATEDELNLILPKRNYGYPNIEGVVDNDLEREFDQKYHTIAPLMNWTPTIAPAGLAYYDSDKIPEWNNSLLLVMLKGQGLRVLKLNEEGNEVVKEEIFLEKMYGRIRDLCVSPAGDVYLSTSNHDWNPMTTPAQRDDRILRIAKVDKAVVVPLKAKSADQSNTELSTGETLYQQYCFSCHKEKGEGLEGIYPALVGSDIVKDKSKLIQMVMYGKTAGDYAMPAFSFLEDEALYRVLNYVRTAFGKELDELSSGSIREARAGALDQKSNH